MIRFFWLHSSFFTLEKQPKNLNLYSFFISKIILGGYFQWNVCTHFKKIRISTRHEPSEFFRGTSIFLVAHPFFSRKAKKLNFQSFVISKRIVGGFFQCNVYTHIQKVCIWICHQQSKLVAETTIFLIALLRFYFRKIS